MAFEIAASFELIFNKYGHGFSNRIGLFSNERLVLFDDRRTVRIHPSQNNGKRLL